MPHGFAGLCQLQQNGRLLRRCLDQFDGSLAFLIIHHAAGDHLAGFRRDTRFVLGHGKRAFRRIERAHDDGAAIGKEMGFVLRDF